MDNQMTISTISDALYDDIIIYKLFNNPTLLESLKRIERPKVFTAIEEFYVDNLKVRTVFLLITIINLLLYFGFSCLSLCLFHQIFLDIL